MAKNDLIHKAVIFNPDDPYQASLLKHTAKYPNFSGYIKRLIDRDMLGQYAFVPPPIEEAANDTIKTVLDSHSFI